MGRDCEILMLLILVLLYAEDTLGRELKVNIRDVAIFVTRTTMIIIFSSAPMSLGYQMATSEKKPHIHEQENRPKRVALHAPSPLVRDGHIRQFRTSMGVQGLECKKGCASISIAET